MFPIVQLKKVDIIVWLMMSVTLLAAFWGNYVIAPGPVKLIYSAALWVCVALFPISYVLRNRAGKSANILLILIVVLTFIAVIRSSFFSSGVVIGNKWLTMFGNPECMFMLLTPCYAYLAEDDDCLILLKKAVVVFMFIGIFGLLFGRMISSEIIWITMAFFPYFLTREKMLAGISLLMCIYSACFAENTYRTMFLILFIVIVGYVMVYKIKNMMLVKVVCLSFLALPLLLFVFILLFSQNDVIGDIFNFLLNTTNDEILAADTRTFLYSEMSADLTENHSWILGKGAYSHYYSPFFLMSNTGQGDHYERLYSEVTLLQLLLRSGIVYVVCYCSIIALAILRALKKSKNRFLVSVSVIASGWVLVSCISYLNGCSFLHLGFFLLVGCCLSRKWLDKTDDEIESMFRKDAIVLQHRNGKLYLRRQRN